MNNEIISLRKEKKLTISTLTEEIQQMKINKRKNKLFTFFMNLRTKQTSNPVTNTRSCLKFPLDLNSSG